MKFSPLAALVLLAACSPAGQSAGEAPKGDAPAAGPQLVFPVDCVVGQTCEIQNYVDRDPGPGAKDYRCEERTYQAHNGVDIRIPNMSAQRAGVYVLAAAPGVVARLRDGVADVSVRAPDAAAVDGVECGNGLVVDHGEGWETQYCHLARNSLLVKQGERVEAGQAIARIGLSGNTEYPHLHFTVRHAGTVIDPFAPDPAAGGCAARGAMWTPAAQAAMAYREGAVLNTGFSSGAVSMEAVEDGGVAEAAQHAPALVAYVRAIGLEGGDVQHLEVTAPDGSVLAKTDEKPLDRAKAQYLLFAGRRTPADGWPTGAYRARYWVDRGGERVLQREFQIAF